MKKNKLIDKHVNAISKLLPHIPTRKIFVFEVDNLDHEERANYIGKYGYSKYGVKFDDGSMEAINHKRRIKNMISETYSSAKILDYCFHFIDDKAILEKIVPMIQAISDDMCDDIYDSKLHVGSIINKQEDVEIINNISFSEELDFGRNIPILHSNILVGYAIICSVNKEDASVVVDMQCKTMYLDHRMFDRPHVILSYNKDLGEYDVFGLKIDIKNDNEHQAG